MATTAPPPLCPVSVFASAASASSYYVSPSNGWHPDRVTGPPDVNGCSESRGAWSPATGGAESEWLRVVFEPPIFPEALDVWESSNAPFVTKIEYESAVRASALRGKAPPTAATR